MNKLAKKLNTFLIAAFIFAALFLVGCGDSEMTKEITGTVKKAVENEVAKKGEGLKKQFDQLINPGAGRGQKEDGQNSTGADKEKSVRSSNKESSEED